jgi:bifunctional ADP-heptose synthase (sugar kinase/adenylyltransferase)
LTETDKTFRRRLSRWVKLGRFGTTIEGLTRPIHPSDERAAIVASLAPVDYVTVFEDDTPCETISRLKPDVHVKGGD